MNRGAARTRVILVVAAGLIAQLALAAGGLGALSVAARVTLAFVTMILLPGGAFVSLLGAPPGGRVLAPGWALGFGIAWNGVLVLLTRAFGAPFTVLAWWSVPLSAALWTFVMLRPPGRDEPPPPRLGGAALGAVLLAAALAGGFSARIGPPMTYVSDTPDHVGTLRRMLQEGDAFPNDAFFRDAGRQGADPRKGLWHAEVAGIARLAAADPAEVWRVLPALLVVLLVLNVAAFGWLIGGGAGASVAAWAVVLTYGGSLVFSPLRQTVFASRLADHLATATAVAVLWDLERRRAATRWAAAVLAFAAVVVHVYAAIQFAIVFTALGLGLLLRDRALGGQARRLAGTVALIVVVATPYLAWRMVTAYAPGNLIHTEPQGLLTLAGPLRVVSFGVLWEWVGVAWVLFPLAWYWLWTRGRHSAATLYVLTTSLAVFLLLFNPLAVALLQPRVGYLMMRMSWMLPLPALLAWAIPALARVAAGAGVARARQRAAAGLAIALVVLSPALGDAAYALSHLRQLAAAEQVETASAWGDALRWMDRRLPPGRVVLSDPVTSYSIPMMTHHYVATLVDQHSSPNDSLALTRILDARDALDPYAAWERTAAVVRRYGVNVIALNNRFRAPPRLDYWAPNPAWFAGARARLDRHPDAFAPLYDTGDFVLYAVRPAALDRLHEAPTPRPFVMPWSADRAPIGRRLGEGVPLVLGFALWPAVAAPGDSVRGVVEWRAHEPLPPGSYSVAVRFDRALPGGLQPPAFVGKPIRKLIERVRHERYRFRSDHLPVGGEYGVDRWSPAEEVRDSFRVEIPRDMADGLYRVEVRMMHQPHYANLRLSDYFYDDDSFSGLPVGRFEIRRPGAPAAAPESAPGGSGGH